MLCHGCSHLLSHQLVLSFSFLFFPVTLQHARKHSHFFLTMGWGEANNSVEDTLHQMSFRCKAITWCQNTLQWSIRMVHLNLFQPSRTQKEIYHVRSHHEIMASCLSSSSSAFPCVPLGDIWKLWVTRAFIHGKDAWKQAANRPGVHLSSPSLWLMGRGIWLSCAIFAAVPTNFSPFLGSWGSIACCALGKNKLFLFKAVLCW